MARPNQAPKPSAPSPAVRSTLQLKRIYGRRPLKEWRQLLAEVAAMDRTSEPLIRPALQKAIALTIVSVVLAFAATALIYLAVLALASAGLALFFFIRWRRLRSADLTNDFRRVLLRFLKIIAEDVAPKGRISLLLDLSGPTKQKMAGQRQLPPGRFRKVVERVYSDPWCRMQAPLSNGSRLQLTIENTYTVLDRHWKSASGKFKRKSKWKKLVVVTAGLIPDPDRLCFDHDRVRERSRSEKLKLVGKRGGEVGRLTRKFKFKDIQLPEASVAPEELVSMFFLLGSMLKPCARS